MANIYILRTKGSLSRRKARKGADITICNLNVNFHYFVLRWTMQSTAWILYISNINYWEKPDTRDCIYP